MEILCQIEKVFQILYNFILIILASFKEKILNIEDKNTIF